MKKTKKAGHLILNAIEIILLHDRKIKMIMMCFKNLDLKIMKEFTIKE